MPNNKNDNKSENDILANDARFCWHPFTQHQTEAEPIVIESASGSKLLGADGKVYLDLISSWWTCLHGHAHPHLQKALSDQAAKMGHVMFAGFTHEPATELARKIAAILPGKLERTFFSDNGSTAVEVAMKLAYQFWKNSGEARNTFIALEGAYHGDTVGAMSVGKGSGFFALYNDLLCNVETLPFADTWVGDETIEAREAEIFSSLDKLLVARAEDIAAIVIEPMLQGAGGIRMCRPEFLAGLVKRAREAGVLVIFDEVATGFGRTGKMFAMEYVPGGEPDIVCLSKGLTGGAMPLSLTVTTQEIFEAFKGPDFSTALPHGHSYTANPLGCAIALASLEIFAKEQTLEKNVGRISEYHKRMMSQLVLHPLIEKPRQLGTIMAFDLAGQGDGYKSESSLFLRDWYLANGLNIRPLGRTVYFWPPFSFTNVELASAYDGLFRGLEALQTKNL